MKCSIRECPGSCEERRIVHTVRYQNRLIVIYQVPAEVCSICGEVLLRPKTIRRIEEMLRASRDPDRTAPVYEYVS